MTRSQRQFAKSLEAYTDAQLETSSARLVGERVKSGTYKGAMTKRAIRDLEAVEAEITKRRDAKHAAFVEANADDVKALRDYFLQHGDTQSYERLVALGVYQ
jgi:hypothetical protein